MEININKNWGICEIKQVINRGIFKRTIPEAELEINNIFDENGIYASVLKAIAPYFKKKGDILIDEENEIIYRLYYNNKKELIIKLDMY